MSAPDVSREYAEAMEFLLQLKARGVRPGLDRMRRLIEAMGNPERIVPCIHIAGTNGKGSVAAMLEAMLRTAGWRTGLYTSPHLVRLGERVQVNRHLLTESELVGYVRELAPRAAPSGGGAGSEEGPSYFEFMTALALLHFARTQCDIVCIEAGMGGRLDATNIVTPEVSVITSIGMDHAAFLGSTIRAIATEKAGIIKAGRPTVIGRMTWEAESTIRAIATERGSTVTSVAEVFGGDHTPLPQTNLEGVHQRWNAATAVLAARLLPPQWRLSDAIMTRALQSVDWPARWQRFSVAGRTVIIDAAHNADGALALEAALRMLTAETGRPPVIVAGVLGRDRVEVLMEVAARHACEIHLVVPAQSRACTHEQLRAAVPTTYRGAVLPTTVEAVFPGPGECTAGGAGDCVVVAGSVALAGEVLVRLEPHRGPYEGRWQDF